jgi:glycosyltransferase involved in cell wall biosynthesis
MKIVATVAVKDEVELVERCVRHLQRIGVSHVYVFDLYSTDGTAQILQRLAAGPGITVGNFSDEDPVAYKATVQGQIETLRHSGADWAIFLDADEFWIPASGDLRDCAALADHDVLTVRRFNVPLGPDGPLCAPDLGPAHYADLQFFARDIPRFRVAMQRDADLSWIRGVPKYKAMARPAVMDGIGEGLHDVVSHSQVRRTTPQDLLIAHLPFTSFSR